MLPERVLLLMHSPFMVNQQPLQLSRFPVTKNDQSNLQAWDAVDEYIINHLHELSIPSPSKIIVFNDNFGALSLNLLEHHVSAVNDSFVSQQGIHYNLQHNQLVNDNLTLLNSLQALPNTPDIILLKIPKSNALLIEQLCQISQIANQHTIIIAGARAKDIHRSTLKLFEQYLGHTTTSLAVKKARLVLVNYNKQPQLSPYPTVWPLEHTKFNISNHANVFAREKLDIGARFFSQNLPQVQPDYQVFDLGCGNGVIGLSVLAQQPLAKLHFVDESFMAIASARQNITNNLPAQLENCQFIANDCLTNIDANYADIILCNPPFHQQQAITDHIAWQMFNDSFRVLKPGGELRIIGNRQLAYHVKLKRLFGQCTVIASNHKFVVLSSIKP